MPITMVASVKTAPIVPKMMGIVSVSRVLLDAETDAELEAPGGWVALALGPKFARGIFGGAKGSEVK
jgi:hypothetical protein